MLNLFFILFTSVSYFNFIVMFRGNKRLCQLSIFVIFIILICVRCQLLMVKLGKDGLYRVFIEKTHAYIASFYPIYQNSINGSGKP